MYANGPKIVTDGLVLCLDAGNAKSYPGSGTVWTDLSRTGNNGTLVNGPTFSGDNKGSIFFDGSNDKIDCGNGLNLQITTGTITAWFRATNGNSDYNGIIAKQNAWALFVQNNILASYDWGNSTARSTGITVGNSYWHHAAMTFTETVGTPSNNAIIYLNGIARLTTTIKHLNHDITVQIGDANANQYFTGNIATAQIYNKVLSAAEILQNYNATKGRFNNLILV